MKDKTYKAKDALFKRKAMAVILSALISVFSLAGCSDASANDSADAVSAGTADKMFTERDLDPSYDKSGAAAIELSGEDVTITEEGTYIITGSQDDGQIIINVDDTEKVQLVLDDVTMTNDDSACILVESADKVFITVPEGSESTLSDGGSEYIQASDEYTVDGVIFSRDDITINGEGTLNINAGYKHAVVSKDDLKVVSTDLEITSAGKGLAGADSVRIYDGTFNIDAGDDAIHTSNYEEADKGFVYIRDGEFNISSGDDGIHAEQDLTILGGDIEITSSVEGIEGHTIEISGGDIDVTSSDDGLNAPSLTSGGTDTSGSDADFGGGGMAGEADQSALLHITGGSIHLDTGGDSLDSNGSIVIDGGDIVIDGPPLGDNGIIDCGTTAEINGGTLTGSGNSGMGEMFGESSGQHVIYYSLGSSIAEGTEVSLKNSGGNVVLTYTAAGGSGNVIFSSPEIENGTYTIEAGSQSVTVEVSGIITNNAGGMAGGMGGPGGQAADMSGGPGGQQPRY